MSKYPVASGTCELVLVLPVLVVIRCSLFSRCSWGGEGAELTHFTGSRKAVQTGAFKYSMSTFEKSAWPQRVDSGPGEQS